VSRRRAFSLHTVRGLIASGLAAGALLAAVLIGWRLVLVQRGLVPAVPAEPEATAPAALPPSDLRERTLLIPVQGVQPAALSNTFGAPRGGGTRVHHALDIMAARGTPVQAVEGGTVVRLHRGGAGGITVYQLDAASRYGYYYAHLDRYAPGLSEGKTVTRGEVLGYVGTTGNAPPDAPHLHFAIYEVTDPKRPWRGRPIDPYPLWR
jgi:murein DD-endopeptidase MepM/ murein hydrolase activator NlpD